MEQARLARRLGGTARPHKRHFSPCAPSSCNCPRPFARTRRRYFFPPPRGLRTDAGSTPLLFLCSFSKPPSTRHHHRPPRARSSQHVLGPGPTTALDCSHAFRGGKRKQPLSLRECSPVCHLSACPEAISLCVECECECECEWARAREWAWECEFSLARATGRVWGVRRQCGTAADPQKFPATFHRNCR